MADTQNLAKALWPLALAAAAAFLLWPAIYNGFPVVFPDTGAYLSVAWGHFWTMDRSGFYGFFLRPLSFLPPLAQLWIAIGLQAAAIAAVLFLVCRKILRRASPLKALMVVALLSILTPLPWHAAQLLPDAFTGIAVLLVWLACSRNLSDSGALTLWFAAYLTGLLHYTHVVLIVVAGAATLLVQFALRTSTRSVVLRRGGACALVAASILATQVVTNGAFLGRWSPAPLGPMFVFARLHEDGLVQPWLAEHCRQGQTPMLCRVEGALPRGSQEILWRDDSPVRKLILESDHADTNRQFVSELRKASLGAIVERPFRFGGDALEDWGEQSIHFQVLDDECPEVCRAPSAALYGWIYALRPTLLAPLLRSRQLTGSIPKNLIRSVTTPVTILALLLMPWLFARAGHRRDVLSCSLLAAVAAALLGNALITGALSDVHDRYQSRVVWLAPLAVILVMMRLRLSQQRTEADL